ncbi:MAG: acyltransferase [Lachnospiraceae bacterium]|nr:acyltransferase [Lachnospiraceae bacterium]
MRDYLLMIYPIALLVLIFAKAKRTGSKTVSSDFISIGQSKMIQASACIAIILHHITQDVTVYGSSYKGPVTMLNYIGIFFTALFFFFSGYGLITSLLTKSDYLDGFLLKRLPTVLIPFWFINTLGLILNVCVYGAHRTFSSALSDIFGLTLINSNGWFIVEIAILYLLFYIIFRLIKNKDIALIVMCAATVIVILHCMGAGHDLPGNKAHWFKGEWWYNSTAVFIFGMLFARFKNRLTAIMNKYYRILLPVFSVLTVVSTFICIFAVIRYGYYDTTRDQIITLLIQSIGCLIFTVFVLLLNMRITIGNKALNYLSSISVELFLIHGYFVNRIFGEVRMNDFLRYAVVIVCSVASTAVIAPPVHFIKDKTIYALSRLKRGKTYNDTIEGRLIRKRHEKRVALIRKVSIAVLGAGVITYVIITFRGTIFAKSEYKQEMADLVNANVGDEVYWGHFECDHGKIGKERLRFIVIEKTTDSAVLLCKYGIDGRSFNRKHENVSWENSDIRAYINSPEYIGSFSMYELGAMERFKGDYITLLTVQEAANAFDSDRERQLLLTPAAKSAGVNVNSMSKANMWDMKDYRSSWWWLMPKQGEESVTAPIVTVDGEILEAEKEINRPGGAIRPVIRIQLKQQSD